MKKLRRSSDDKMLAGICGGLGNYFNIDPVIFRIIFVIIALPGGISVLVYFLMWLVIPRDDRV